ncbi:MAG: hypothetical protein ACREAC_16795, partial [Blastocatellia bacterium]
YRSLEPLTDLSSAGTNLDNQVIRAGTTNLDHLFRDVATTFLGQASTPVEVSRLTIEQLGTPMIRGNV